ncbi:MAG: DJ-1/PfpI family protein [Candidatus Micrarchaeia archaeon]
MARVLMVIAPSSFRDEELFDTRAELERAGHAVAVASTVKGEATGMLGGKARAEVAVSEARAGEFDAIVFVGGTGVEESELYEREDVLSLARDGVAKGRIVAAICIAPRILAKAGVLRGRRATCFQDPTTARFLAEGGASNTRADVEIDGRLITANGPRAAKKFGQAIAAALG